MIYLFCNMFQGHEDFYINHVQNLILLHYIWPTSTVQVSMSSWMCRNKITSVTQCPEQKKLQLYVQLPIPVNPNLNSDVWHTFATLCVMYIYYADCFEHGNNPSGSTKLTVPLKADVWSLVSYRRHCGVRQTYLFTITHILSMHKNYKHKHYLSL